MTAVDLGVRARVPNLHKPGLVHSSAKAAELCPVSNALRGSVSPRFFLTGRDK